MMTVFFIEPIFASLSIIAFILLVISKTVMRGRLQGESKPAHLPQIDGLRAVLAFIVFASHYSFTFGDQRSWTGLISNSYAVQFFALLSGYVLIRSFKSHDATELRSFVVKRFFRIYPLYLISFLLGLAAIGLSDSVKTIVIYVPQLLQHVFMLDLYQIGWQMQGPTWSIYPEIAFSLLLPVVVLVFGHRREGIMLTLAVIFIYFNGQGGPYVTMFGYFFAGAALYLSEQRLARLLPASWLTNAILLTGFAAAVAILIVQRDFVGEALAGTYLSKLYGWLGLGLHSLAFAAILMIFIAAQFCAPVRAILSRRTMVFFGHISYGIYILHMPVLWVIRQAHFDFKSGLFTFADPEGLPGSPLVFALVYAPAIILLAWLAHRAIELPFMSLGAKAARRPIAAPQI